MVTYEIAETPVGDLSTEKILNHLRRRRRTVASARHPGEIARLQRENPDAKTGVCRAMPGPRPAARATIARSP